MPYKDKEKQREAQRNWARNNRDTANKSRQAFRLRQRKVIQDAKAKPCIDCNVQYPYYVMQFDHRDPEDKAFPIGSVEQHSPSMERLLAEIAKCDVVCANCHAERTHGDAKQWKIG